MSTDYSKGALLKFLDIVVAQGLMNANTAGGFKAACSKILDDLAEGDDVRSVDVNTAVVRYNNRNPGALSPNSLAEYQRRVTRVIADFISWSDDPRGFKPKGKGKSTRNGRKTEPSDNRQTTVPRPEAPTHSGSPTAPTSAGLPLSYPLRPDFLAQVVIPRDLTAEEARRLGAFLVTLAVDFRPAGFGEGK